LLFIEQIMRRKNAFLGDKLLLQMSKCPAPAEAASESNPMLLPSDPSEDFLSAEDWVNIAAATKLTARELEVASLLFAGKTRAGVARRLQLDVQTVRVYIDRLFKKLGVRDLRGMILRIARLHLAVRSTSSDPVFESSHTKM
jgi:DNA-binding NarL/FixJ family response regulator